MGPEGTTSGSRRSHTGGCMSARLHEDADDSIDLERSKRAPSLDFLDVRSRKRELREEMSAA